MARSSFSQGFENFSQNLCNNTCAGVLFFTRITGLNKVIHSLGIYILKHCLFFQGVLLLTLLQFCLFLDIVKLFFPAVILIFSIRVICLFYILKKKIQGLIRPNCIKKILKPRKRGVVNKIYFLCCSMKGLPVPKRVYDKCDFPLFIASLFAAEVRNGIQYFNNCNY